MARSDKSRAQGTFDTEVVSIGRTMTLCTYSRIGFNDDLSYFHFRIQAILPSNQIQVSPGGDKNFAANCQNDFNRRTSPIVIEDRIMQNLETYARKVESDIFETATSKVG